jgi:hypothetical protein
MKVNSSTECTKSLDQPYRIIDNTEHEQQALIASVVASLYK